MSTLRLFNGDNRQLYKSAQVLDVFGLPDLSDDDILSLEYTYMRRTSSLDTPWEIVAPGGYSLKIGIFSSTDIQLAYQNSFTDDAAEGKKLGVLSLSDAAMTTALGNSESIKPWLEIRIDDADGPRTVYRRQIFVTKHSITNAAVTIPPTETGATESWAKALFVPRDGTNAANPCDQIIMLSRPSGLTKILTITDDGEWQVTNV